MKSEHGFSLIEVTVALAVIGITVVGLISGLGVASNTLRVNDLQETGKDLASAEMEYVQNLTYNSSGNYTPLDLSESYPGFSVNIASTQLQVGLQQITITIQQGSKTVYTLECQKVKW
jgi:prepilin-type N-terminal cleavage/methylation domain-containing protein